MIRQHRGWLILLIGLCFTLTFAPLSTPAANAAPHGALMVTRFDDPTPNGCAVGDCSLREAIIAANGDSDTDLITFTADTEITLFLTGGGENNAQTGDLDITAPLVIQGAGNTINAGELDRIFDIHGMAGTNEVTMRWLTLENGVAGSEDGGGIRIADQSDVTLEMVVIKGNRATNGGGIATHGALTLSASAVVLNEALAEAGGILTYRAIGMNNTTISSNKIGLDGQVGGVFHIADGVPLQNMNLNSVTAAANEGAQVGTRGINGGGARTYLRNTVVDGSVSGSACYTNSASGSSAETYSSGYNIATNSSCNLGGTADMPSTNPQLTELLYEYYHYPMMGSPILDSGDTALSIDQRQSPRPYDMQQYPNTTDGDDRGAIEFYGEFYTVTRLDDPEPDGCAVGDCSLREAVSASDTPGGILITFGVNGTFELSRGSLQLHGLSVLTGNGAENTIIDANGQFRVFEIFESANNPAPWCNPTIEKVTITGGNANGGAGIAVEGDCTMSLRHSVVRNNTSTGMGGGIAHPSIGAGEITISHSAIISNTATHGGGIWIESHGLNLSNSTISGNSATGKGGGLYFAPSQEADFRVLLEFVTLANNNAMTGDAIAYEEQNAPQDSSVQLFNTIMQADGGSACATIGMNTLRFESIGFNMASDSSCTITGLADLPNTDAQLAPLQWLQGEQGYSYVHIPVLTSPALDSGSAGVINTDQLGRTRPVDLPGIINAIDGADRGAYEHQSLPPTAVSLSSFDAQTISFLPVALVALGSLTLATIVWGWVKGKEKRMRDEK